MNKNCDNCYWKNYSDRWCIYEYKKPIENICKQHDFVCDECDRGQSEYKYKEKYYCWDCLIKKFEIEESTEISYYKNGEYIGNDSNFQEVIKNLNKDIEIL